MASQHPYQPDPDDIGWCRCGLPKNNQRVHVDAPSVPDISEQRDRHHDDEHRMPAPAQMHSPTSVQAALDIGARLGHWQQQVMAALAEVGMRGCTDEELIRRIDPEKPNTIRPRRIELVDAGLVAPLLDNTGKQVERKNRSGRSAVVYVLTPAGRERAA